MNFSELIVLLPCHSLEDFPLYHEGDEAEGLLAAWSALWHPALVASARKIPTWQRADTPPAEVAGRLIVVPAVSYDRLPAGFAARAKAEGATLIAKVTQRSEIVAAALAALAAPPAPDSPAADAAPPEGNAVPAVDGDLSADFLALGYARLQVELLTRQMRYASNLDEPALERFAVAAADAAVAGNADEARAQLQSAFNLLGEARKYFYPVDSYLIDLTLTAPTTLGPALARAVRANRQEPAPARGIAGHAGRRTSRHADCPARTAGARWAIAGRR